MAGIPQDLAALSDDDLKIAHNTAVKMKASAHGKKDYESACMELESRILAEIMRRHHERECPPCVKKKGTTPDKKTLGKCKFCGSLMP